MNAERRSAIAAYLEHRGKLSARFASAEDLERLPIVLTKDDLRRNYPWGLLCVPKERVHQYHESFGTTGVPIASPLTREDLEAYVEQILLTPFDLGRGDLVLVRFPYAISVPAHLFHRAAHARGAAVVAASSYSAISPPARVLRLVEQLGATVLACLPFEAVRLAHFARWQGYEPGKHFRTLRAVCTAGEVLGPAMRRYIESLWGAPVHQFYGSTEAGNVAYSCGRGSLHLAEPFFRATIVDEPGRSARPEGRPGTLVLTTLRKEALPLLKYDTEDWATLNPAEACGCGDAHAVLEILGRRGEHYDFAPPGGKDGALRILHTSVKEAIYGLALERGTSPFFRCERMGERLVIRLESEAPDPVAERWLEQRLGVDVELLSVRPGSLVDMASLSTTELVQKPKYCH
ncbi:phenylacetate--CoA ligase family protein [Sorangium sp. So ce131]|uniref:phenylacetate--CoA ligase family protein n=1 Tax=Sorangium sp. So ce131 TaxID=3133282 RepID=UPI003F6018F2